MTEKTPREIAQAGYSLALKRLSEKKATNVADAMGLSDSQISTIKTQQLEQAILLLANLDIKCVPSGSRCMSPEAFAFLTKTHERVMQRAPTLVWSEDE